MVQIDISMPKCCADCPCCYDSCDCNVADRHIEDDEREEIFTKRMDWCPLKELHR